MTSAAAPNCTNEFSCAPLSMCRLTFDAPVEKHTDNDESDEESLFHKYLRGLKIKALKDAFLMLMPTFSDMDSVPADPANAIFCRTGEKGEILEIQEGQIDSGVPPVDSTNWKKFSPGSTYTYYWTLNQERFHRVVEDARRNLSMATRIHDFASFQVERAPRRRPHHMPYELLKDRYHGDKLNDIFDYALFTSPLSSPGVLWGSTVEDATGVAHLFGYRQYIFARRRVADLIYASELSFCHAVGLRARSAKEYALFSQAADICSKVEHRERLPDVDEAAAHQLYRQEWVRYAYTCAKKGVDRKVFSRAAAVVVNYPKDWLDAAHEIDIQTGGEAAHPCIDYDAGRWNLKPVADWVAMRYFDFYSLGREPWMLNAVGKARDNQLATQNWMETLSRQIARLLASVCYQEVLLCMCHFASERSEDDLHRRYLELSTNVYHAWWKSLNPAAEKGEKKAQEHKREERHKGGGQHEGGDTVKQPSDWENLRVYLEHQGTYLDKVFSVYAAHFGSFEKIQEYNEMLKKAEEVTHLTNQMVTWNDFLGGKPLKVAKGELAAAVDLSSGLVTVTENEKKVMEFQLVVEEIKDLAITDKQRKALSPFSLGARVRFRKAKGIVPPKFVKFNFEPKMRVPNSWPAWLGVFGQVMTTTIAVSELIDKFRETETTTGERLVAVAAVAKEGLQLLDSSSAALRATFQYASETGAIARYYKIGEKLKGPGLCLEAVLNIGEGMTLLFSDQSEARLATIRGEYIEGQLLEAQGIVLVASATPGIAAILTGAGVVAASEVLFIPLALAGLFKIGVAVHHYIATGPSNYYEPLKDNMSKAQVREFGESLQGNRTADSLRNLSHGLDGVMHEFPQSTYAGAFGQ